MRLLLDTHAFLWMSLDHPQLSPHAHGLMADTGNELLLSPASYWELAIKVSLGKYQLAESLACRSTIVIHSTGCSSHRQSSNRPPS